MSTKVPPPAASSLRQGRGFQMMVHGVVEGAECVEVGCMFARTQLFFGPDWSFLESNGGYGEDADADADEEEEDLVVPTYSNNAEVVTQLSDCAKGPIPYFSFTAPFEFALTSTNPFGWPQLVITLHTVEGAGGGSSKNADGSDTQLLGSGESIIGYGRCFVPMQSGYHTKKVPMMQLESSTPKQQLISLLTREKPVLRDLSFLCSGDDQVMLRARPLDGYVRLNFSVMINGMESAGFER
ncbi:b9 domain-containing protein 1 [Novymonas esmeraldas]|uniref:B9 domain-containing protein 1 n=1 Tax=Novymonas esmeraldas TaxID=1808958 RepID=A0AAW0F354_9TRYP